MTEEGVLASWRGRANDNGVAVICGHVSGDLEMLELECDVTDSVSMAKIATSMDEDVFDVWTLLCQEGYSEWTPSGGLHLLYRIMDHEVPGNTKIASTAEHKTLAETRGEGGYVIVAPSPGACHPCGEPWTVLSGSPETIPEISWAARNAVHAAIRDALDESPPPPPPRPARELVLRPAGHLSPGDDFTARVDWADILIPFNWTLHPALNAEGERMWVRPGKRWVDGASASTDYNGKPGLYIWSTSTGMPSEEPLSKLYVYAHYRHGGDMARAARELYQFGYGTRREQANDDVIMGIASNEVGAFPDKGVTSVSSAEKRLRPYTHTDCGMADLFALEGAEKFAFVPERNKWMYWDGQIWRLDYRGVRLRIALRKTIDTMLEQAKAAGDETLQKFAIKMLGNGKIEATVNVLTYTTFADAPDFDADRNLLNVHNGTLNLATGELLEHSPKLYQTKMMGAGYNPDALAPRWDKYLEEVIPDPAIRDYLQRMVGYTMTGNPVQRALAILHGPGGTGKSRFIEILSALFGSYGTTAADSLFRSKRDQTGPSNDLNDLRGARLASVSELDYGVRMDEALVKRLTGLDRITSRGLYEENQTWMPQCVIWLATNHHFRISGDDGAIWDRIKVIPFTQKIEKKDPFILDKLLEEADGILNWMLAGLQMYYEHGLDAPDGVREAVDEYKGEQDMVTQFVTESVSEDRLHSGDVLRIHTTQLFAMFRAWCSDQAMTPLGRTRFYRRMESIGYDRVKGGDGFWYWIGLGPGMHGILGSL